MAGCHDRVTLLHHLKQHGERERERERKRRGKGERERERKRESSNLQSTGYLYLWNCDMFCLIVSQHDKELKEMRD